MAAKIQNLLPNLTPYAKERLIAAAGWLFTSVAVRVHNQDNRVFL